MSSPGVWNTGRSGRLTQSASMKFSIPTGHKYLNLVYQIDLGVTRLLWVGKERIIESFQGFFAAMGNDVISKIVFVCSDCGNAI